jgi:hypothetical protein
MDYTSNLLILIASLLLGLPDRGETIGMFLAI